MMQRKITNNTIDLKSPIKPLGVGTNFFQLALVFINISLNLLPQLKALRYYYILWLVTMVSWFLFILISRPSFYKKIKFHLVIMLFFIFYSVVVPYLFNNPTIGNRYLSLAQIQFYYFAFCFNEGTGNNKMNINIIKWTIPLILFVSYNTIKGLLINPYLSRLIKSGGEDSIELWQQGIGGYDFIYFLTIVSIIIFSIVFLRKNSLIKYKMKISGIFILSLFIINIILSNYFTALIILITSQILFLALKKFSYFKLYIYLILILIFSIWNNQIFSYIINSIIHIMPDGKTVDRLNLLKMSLDFGASSGLTEGRFSTLDSSLMGFINNPLFGIIVEPLNINGNYLTGFGQHSQFFDTLALFGFWGILQIYIILKPFMLRMRKYQNLSAFNMAVLSAVLILNTFNNSAPLIGYAFFFIYPTAYSWLEYKLETT